MIIPSWKFFVGRWLIITVWLTVCSTSTALAQKFSLGVKGGPLVLWSPYGDKYDGQNVLNKPKFGYYGAGVINFPLKNNYTCVVEVGFSQKGRKVEFEGKKNNGTFYFLDAALLLRKSFNFYLGKNIPSTWFVNVGPHVSYWLGGKGTIGVLGAEGSPYTLAFVDSLNANDFAFDKMYLVDANRWIFGADIGVGMTAPIRSTQRVLVELRFTWGHTFYGSATTANYNWIDFTDNNLRANERVISLTAAYMFDFDLQKAKKGKSTKDKETKRKPVRRRGR